MSVESSDNPSDPITFEDLGIPRQEHTQDTILGKARTCSDITKKEIAYLVISVLSLSSALGITIYNATGFPTTSEDFTFALLLILQIGFCAYYVLHGVFSERPYELIVFVAATFLLIIYIVINFSMDDTSSANTVKLVRLIIIGVLGPVDVIWGVIIAVKYHRHGNLIFRSVGASPELQAACKTLNFFETCLKLDLQLECSLLLLVLQKGTITTTLQQIVLGIGFPFSIIWLILGFVTVRMEQKIALIVFLAASWCEPAYIVYIIVKCAQSGSTGILDIAAYLCSGFGLILRVLVIVWMIRVYKNFGIGLKEKLFRQQPELTKETEESAG